jgi:hypothetical protein
MKTVISCIAGLVCCCLVTLPSAHTQVGKGRVVESSVGEGPVEFVGLSVAGQKARVLDSFVAGKDWLRTLTLKFKNTHARSIVHMRVELEVEKTGDMRYPLRLPMTFGERPTQAPTARPSESPERIAPNKEKELTLSESTYDFLLQYMQENQVEDIDKVKVFVELVVFDDDMAWGHGGHVLRRDPNDPQRWVVKGVWQRGRASFYRPESTRPAG